jgi:hypothetical protein
MFRVVKSGRARPPGSVCAVRPNLPGALGAVTSWMAPTCFRIVAWERFQIKPRPSRTCRPAPAGLTP